MRKILIFLMSLLLGVSLFVACNSETSDSSNSGNTGSSLGGASDSSVESAGNDKPTDTPPKEGDGWLGKYY